MTCQSIQKMGKPCQLSNCFGFLALLICQIQCLIPPPFGISWRFGHGRWPAAKLVRILGLKCQIKNDRGMPNCVINISAFEFQMNHKAHLFCLATLLGDGWEVGHELLRLFAQKIAPSGGVSWLMPGEMQIQWLLRLLLQKAALPGGLISWCQGRGSGSEL
jgi:hypothetical protein